MLALHAGSLFAHRGLHDARMPRNSLAAIVAAADAGYGIEFDIHLSGDGVPVVSHDPDTLHDTGLLHVIEQTPAAVLRELRFAGSDERLTTLDAVLANVPPGTPLLVEIKPTRRITEVVDAVAARVAGREQSVALQSFHPGIVRVSRHRHPQFAAGQLGEPAEADFSVWRRLHARTLASNAFVRPDFLALEVSMVEGALAGFWRRRLQCPLLAWTVRTAAEAAACERAGAGMIFEDWRP